MVGWFGGPTFMSVDAICLAQSGTTGGNGSGGVVRGQLATNSTKLAVDSATGWGGMLASRSAAPEYGNTLRLFAVVFESATSRKVYFGGSTPTTNTDSMPFPSIANHTIFEVAGNLPANAQVAEVSCYSTALTDANVADLLAGVLPETITGFIDGWTLLNYEAGGTYTSIGGSRTLTASGTISAGALTHPVTRTTPGAFSGAITLDGVSLAGSFQGVAAGAFSGAIALDGVSLSGSFGAASGTLTSEPLRTNNGTLLASTALAFVCVYDDTTGALITRKTSVTTNGSGVFTVTDPAIVAGTTYRIDWETSGGHRRMPRKLAA
jgi:hypothetical protein